MPRNRFFCTTTRHRGLIWSLGNAIAGLGQNSQYHLWLGVPIPDLNRFGMIRPCIESMLTIRRMVLQSSWIYVDRYIASQLHVLDHCSLLLRLFTSNCYRMIIDRFHAQNPQPPCNAKATYPSITWDMGFERPGARSSGCCVNPSGQGSESLEGWFGMKTNVVGCCRPGWSKNVQNKKSWRRSGSHTLSCQRWTHWYSTYSQGC